jgi:M6 family metalloprotease-like protein
MNPLIQFKRAITTGLLLAALLAFDRACTPIPQRNWQNYPHLTSEPAFRKWLIVKCTVEDDATVPSGLDQTIDFFFTVAGAGTGNMIDYYSDVSYGAVSFVGTRIVGWYPAPFKSTDGGHLKRRERAIACANAIPDSDAKDIVFEDYYGIVMMTNRVVDGGACYDGQQSLQIKDRSYNLACVSFDPESLHIRFAAHEMGHGLGMPHSFDNTKDNCGGGPGEYCDQWDMMSAEHVYSFQETNYVTPQHRYNTAGPGLDVPNLLQMGWIPDSRIATYTIGASDTDFTLNALSHPLGPAPLAVKIPDFPFMFTVEYRQQDGWDAGIPANAVVLHTYTAGASPYSFLFETKTFEGATLAGQTLTLGNFRVRVNSTGGPNGTANITIGP